MQRYTLKSAPTHLDGILIREQVDNLKGVCNDSDREQLLSIVAALHHQAVRQKNQSKNPIANWTKETRFVAERIPTFEESHGKPKCVINEPVHQTLHDGHLCLLELLLGISPSGVRYPHRVSDLNIVGEGDIFHLHTVPRPKRNRRKIGPAHPTQAVHTRHNRAKHRQHKGTSTKDQTHPSVSHFPNNFTGFSIAFPSPIRATSLGSVLPVNEDPSVMFYCNLTFI